MDSPLRLALTNAENRADRLALPDCRKWGVGLCSAKCRDSGSRRILYPYSAALKTRNSGWTTNRYRECQRGLRLPTQLTLDWHSTSNQPASHTVPWKMNTRVKNITTPTSKEHPPEIAKRPVVLTVHCHVHSSSLKKQVPKRTLLLMVLHSTYSKCCLRVQHDLL